MTRYPLTIAVGLFLGMMASSASGVLTYSFVGLSNNSIANTATGEAQLFVDVESFVIGLDSGVLFTFRNAGPLSSSITDVYFDDNSLLDLVQLIDADDGLGGDPGVDFSINATPAELPGSNNIIPSFETTPGLSADSDSPIFIKGVNPGEFLGVFYTLQGIRVYQDVIDDLAIGALRIGIKVQGFDDDGSETFTNHVVIPAPSALLLGSMGMGLVGWLRRRRML